VPQGVPQQLAQPFLCEHTAPQRITTLPPVDAQQRAEAGHFIRTAPQILVPCRILSVPARSYVGSVALKLDKHRPSLLDWSSLDAHSLAQRRKSGEADGRRSLLGADNRRYLARRRRLAATPSKCAAVSCYVLLADYSPMYCFKIAGSMT
jgi:hypothetical protein